MLCCDSRVYRAINDGWCCIFKKITYEQNLLLKRLLRSGVHRSASRHKLYSDMAVCDGIDCQWRWYWLPMATVLTANDARHDQNSDNLSYRTVDVTIIHNVNNDRRWRPSNTLLQSMRQDHHLIEWIPSQKLRAASPLRQRVWRAHRSSLALATPNFKSATSSFWMI